MLINDLFWLNSVATLRNTHDRMQHLLLLFYYVGSKIIVPPNFLFCGFFLGGCLRVAPGNNVNKFTLMVLCFHN